MATFVKATKEILATEGMDAVSIRRVSSAAGYSSATLYLYFEDMNELIMMSLISNLSTYADDIINTTP
ncbi:MAG: helix-turn-helix transcriptional regulator, partial [Atopobiaceae bacterium]|nr:helix-turn-helix transcriptional regulator [Atopobiaceae bacterium]